MYLRFKFYDDLVKYFRKYVSFFTSQKCDCNHKLGDKFKVTLVIDWYYVNGKNKKKHVRSLRWNDAEANDWEYWTRNFFRFSLISDKYFMGVKML